MAASTAACSGGAPRGEARQLSIRGFTAADGLTLTRIAGERVTQRLSAEHVAVKPRRVGPFEIGPLPEIVVARGRVELLDDATARAGSADVARIAALASLVHAVPAAVSLLGGFECNVVRDGAPILRVTAERGSVGMGSRDLVLNGVELTNARAGRVLRARRAVWRGSAVWVRGAYTLMQAGSTIAGTGGRFDLELNPVAVDEPPRGRDRADGAAVSTPAGRAARGPTGSGARPSGESSPVPSRGARPSSGHAPP